MLITEMVMMEAEMKQTFRKISVWHSAMLYKTLLKQVELEMIPRGMMKMADKRSTRQRWQTKMNFLNRGVLRMTTMMAVLATKAMILSMTMKKIPMASWNWGTKDASSPGIEELILVLFTIVPEVYFKAASALGTRAAERCWE